jgi:EmrB/QacA subfamily drug resistance transporter
MMEREENKGAALMIVICAAFATFMSKLDLYIVNISLPSIAEHFKASAGQVSLSVLAYMLTGASSLMFFGRLGDRIGLRTVFTAGYALFTAGSLLCGLAWSMNALVAFRLIQGTGGAMILSSAFALIGRHIPGPRAGWAFGLLASGSALGITFGAPLGGLINHFASWRWVFLVNVPVGIAAVAAALKFIPGEKLTEEPGAGYDIPGNLTAFFGLGLLFYSISLLGESAFLSAHILAPLGCSVVLLSAFVFWEAKCRSPLLDLGMFRNKPFITSNLASFTGYMLLAGHGFLLPFYLEQIKGMATIRTGITVALFSGLFVIVSPLAGRLSLRVRPARLSMLGMLSAGGAALAFSAGIGVPGLAITIIYLVWVASSYAFFIPSNNSLAMGSAPEEKKGAASGLFNTINTLGTMLGVTMFQLLYTASTTGPETASGSAARISGFRGAWMFGAAMCAAAALFSAINLRRPPAPDHAHPTIHPPAH